ncbi:MAG TPA: hypothetical protein VE221_07155 [Sphingomicrobium sp.]|nr:hypothetical protein [Sphingomicrobium sp.]
MRALILVAGAALAVSACTSKENANNTMNVEENLGTENMAAPEMNAPEMNATDMNATTTETNVTTNTTTNNTM